MTEDALDTVYDAVLEVMTSHATGLTLTSDKPGNTVVQSQDLDTEGKARWFGAVQAKKNYVSFHLMPVYGDPSLLTDISPELKARLQGKSCFNFKKVNRELFAEVGALTSRGAKAFTS